MARTPEHASGVPVPDLVGMTMDAGRYEANWRDVVLAPADPDGPPLGAPELDDLVITAQSPAPGTRVPRWGSVLVVLGRRDQGGSAGVREPRRPRPGPGAQQAARAVPEDC